jgi:hypothetical protein
MKILKTALLVIVAVYGASAGGASAQGLIGLFELEEGARPAAMGGAFVGLAEEEHALFYNPAGLAYLRELHVSGLFESRFSRASYGSLALALPNVGGQLLFLNVAGITQRDDEGIPLGNFNYSQTGFLMGTGFSLREPPLDLGLPLAAGLQLKIYRVNTLTEGSGTAFSLTPSLLWAEERLSLGGLDVQAVRFGLIAPNLISVGITYGSGHRESWGPDLRLGASATLLGDLTLAADLEANGTFHLGGEWKIPGFDLESLGTAELSVRLGLMNLKNLIAPSVGFGLRVADFGVDYALILHPELPANHRLSFSAVFGPPNALLCLLRPEACPPDDPTH